MQIAKYCHNMHFYDIFFCQFNDLFEKINFRDLNPINYFHSQWINCENLKTRYVRVYDVSVTHFSTLADLFKIKSQNVGRNSVALLKYPIKLSNIIILSKMSSVLDQGLHKRSPYGQP